MRPLSGMAFIAIASGAIFAPSVLGQGTGAQPGTPPAFEIADIHRSAGAMNPYTFISGGVLRGARYDLRKATMLDLIRVAYGVNPETVLGGPNWLEFDRFDIAAKAPASTPPETIRLMLRSLLADRFSLVLHKDTRPMPAYALTAANSKPNLKAAASEGKPECRYVPQPAGATISRMYSCRNMTMAAFAERLHAIAGDYLIDPVVDATGIEGAWDFDLKWNDRSQVLQAGAERTTIFGAVEKQLGMALTLRTIPAPVLVIDRVNEKPTDNPPDIAQKLPPRELEFEVADLKPSPPDEKGCCFEVTPGGGLTARAMDMRVLLAAAWDIDWDHLERFAGLPKWVDSARFDINAKASVNTNAPPLMGSGFIDDDVRLMLRALLIDRFKMKVHYEDRLVNAYTLVAGKPKMKKADPAHRAGCKEARAIANDPRDINPRLAMLIACQNTTMAQFASQLQALTPDDFAYPVEDATGLAGGWDFTLSFSPAWMLRAAGPESNQPTGISSVASDPSGAISLAEAIGRQLGLKLEMRKRMLPVIVIDHIEEKPTAN